jgi:N-acetylglutamate synthase-like GNAT family acetyltransferase
MGDNLQLRAATVGDEQTLAALLSAEGLPAAEFAERSTHFEVIDDGDAVIAAAGLESHGAAALLRSVVVAPAHRGRGLARRLTELMVERARDLGHESLYLLTMDADAYFAGLGFTVVAREDAPEAIRRCRQFREQCPDSAVLMSRTL